MAARGHDTAAQMVHAEALERLHAEVLEQLLLRRRLGEHPVVKLEGEVFVAEITVEHLTLAPLEEYLLGREIDEQLLHIVVRAFSREELARGYVEEGHSAGRLAEVDGGQEVVFLVVEHVVGHGHAGRHQLGDAALYKLLGELGVFQLVAYCHTAAGPYELGQVCVECVVGEAGHLRRRASLLSTVAAARQRYAEYAAGVYGVLQVSLVEVAAAEEEHGVGMLLLEREKLLHHRRKPVVFLGHIFGFTVMGLWGFTVMRLYGCRVVRS